jgi:hypothetical protein
MSKNDHNEKNNEINSDNLQENLKNTQNNNKEFIDDIKSTNQTLSEEDFYPLSANFSLLPKMNILWITISVAGLFALIFILSNQVKKKVVLANSNQHNLSDNNHFSASLPLPTIQSYPSNSSPLLPVNIQNSSVCAPDSLLKEKIRDWAQPTTITLSKNIIITAGHDGLNDIHIPGISVLTISNDGTNGKLDKPVYYQGTERSLEGSVNLRIAPKIQTLLQKYGFNVSFVKAKQGENLRHKMERIKEMIQGNDTFAFEIHFDDPLGNTRQSGSGVIPPNIDPTVTANSTYANVATIINLTNKGISGYDIALANDFGAYPQIWRNGLSGPRRGITILEIDKINKLEPLFRKALKTNNFYMVDELLDQYASKVANVFIKTYNNLSRRDTKETYAICSGKPTD